MKKETKNNIYTIGSIIIIVGAVMFGIYLNNNQQQQSNKLTEAVQLVYDREVELCMCGSEILSNFTRAMEKQGVDMLTCCQQKTTVCMNKQSKSDIFAAAELIRKDLYSKRIGRANCQQGQERQWDCTIPIDFCLTTQVKPGQIHLKD